MKKLVILTALIVLSFGAKSQSTVPTYWDCSSATPPTGWTFDNVSGGSTNYTASSSCDGTSSLRLDADGESLTIFFGQQPGEITYQIGGSTSGAPWEGIFEVRESVDGSTWVTMRTYNSNELPVGSVPCLNESIMTSDPSSRYVQFYYTDKISGSNAKIDEINVAAPVITTATIRVSDDLGSTVLNGGIANPFNSSTGTFAMINDGTTEDLVITDITLAGISGADYQITAPSLPATVAPGESVALEIAFTPSMGDGSYPDEVTIVSNDASNLEYTFAIYGVSGNYATEPSTAITSVTADVNKSYRTVISFSGDVVASDILGGYVVVRSIGAPLNAAPEDGMDYSRGMDLGNGKVIFAGRPATDELSIKARYVIAGTDYYFSVFPYYGSGQFTNYLNTISSTTVSSPATMVSPTEYSGISSATASFVSDLKALINPHTSIFYSNYSTTMINLFLARDTFATVGPFDFTRVINCVYSGETKLFNDPFDWTGAGYSREHTFPHSWMPSFPADNPEQPEYNDQHNLYPTRQTNVNDVRCNYPFGEVVTVEAEFLQGKLGLDASGNRVYEPRDEHKGRAARSLMYMATSYTSSTQSFSFNRPIGNTCSGVGINYGQDQNVIKKWHFQYPPDNFDISRNDFLDSLQSNRNPFVDQPDYACYIDFANMVKIDTPANPCYETSTNDIPNMHLLTYPNPSQGSFRVSFKGEGEMMTLSLTDVTGKVVYSKQIQAQNGLTVYDLSNVDMASGMYLLSIRGNKNAASIPVVISE